MEKYLRCARRSGHAIRVECAKLAVEVGRFHLEGPQRLDPAPVAVRPVETGPRQQLDLAAIDPRLHAVAVLFNLVQPFAARRRLVYQALSCSLIHLGGELTYLLRGKGTFDLPLKVLKEVGPALGMLSFVEAALVPAVI